MNDSVHRTLRPASSGPGRARADARQSLPAFVLVLRILPTDPVGGAQDAGPLPFPGGGPPAPGLPNDNLHGNPLMSVRSAVDEPGSQARDRAGPLAFPARLQCPLVNQMHQEHVGIHPLGQAP